MLVFLASRGSAGYPAVLLHQGWSLRVKISRAAADGSFTASDELVIDFSDLMLRKPVPPEQDLVFSKTDLEGFMEAVLSGLQ